MPEGEKHQADVGFSIETSTLRQFEFLPKEINSHLMSLRVSLLHDRYATLISAYSPTLVPADEAKERFYEDLTRVLDSVLSNHKLFLLGDFNARVGCDLEQGNWPSWYYYGKRNFKWNSVSSKLCPECSCSSECCLSTT